MKPATLLFTCLTGLAVPMVSLAQGSITPSTLLQNKAAYEGTRASFAVTATGTPPLAFQWRLDGRELPDQTNRVLTFNAVQPEDEGDYTVTVSNSAGATVSEAVRLYVVPA